MFQWMHVGIRPGIFRFPDAFTALIFLPYVSMICWLYIFNPLPKFNNAGIYFFHDEKSGTY